MAKHWRYDDKHDQPELPLDDVGKAWFVHNGQAHSAQLCSDETFREAVLSLASRRWLLCDPLRSIWLGSSLDLVDRWFLLCALADAGRAMRLFASRAKAERASVEPHLSCVRV